jgi:hypothetical protein
MLSAPTSTAPAASSREMSGESRSAGCLSRLIFEPARVARPATSNRFFTANGTPASGPSGAPLARSASSAAARLRARAAVTSVKALSSGSSFLMRASAASTTAAADISPPPTARAISSAELSESIIARSVPYAQTHPCHRPAHEWHSAYRMPSPRMTPSLNKLMFGWELRRRHRRA